jgi:hypothetical protein
MNSRTLLMSEGSDLLMSEGSDLLTSHSNEVEERGLSGRSSKFSRRLG